MRVMGMQEVKTVIGASAPKSSHGVKWIHKGSADLYLDSLLSLLNDETPDNAVRLRSSIHSSAWKVTTPNEEIFIKFLASRGIRDRILFRKSRACRAMQGSLLLLEKGFLSPNPVAAGEIGHGNSFLITEWIENGVDLYVYFKTHVWRGSEEKRAFIRRAGLLIGMMHKSGIFHGDLRPGNILVAEDEKGPRFYFIDNERTQEFGGRLPLRLRIKNLAQINMILVPQISSTDRLRFFEAYLSVNPELTPAAKKLVREVFTKSRKKLQRKFPSMWQR